MGPCPEERDFRRDRDPPKGEEVIRVFPVRWPYPEFDGGKPFPFLFVDPIAVATDKDPRIFFPMQVRPAIRTGHGEKADRSDISPLFPQTKHGLKGFSFPPAYGFFLQAVKDRSLPNIDRGKDAAYRFADE